MAVIESETGTDIHGFVGIIVIAIQGNMLVSASKTSSFLYKRLPRVAPPYVFRKLFTRHEKNMVCSHYFDYLTFGKPFLYTPHN